MIAMDEFGARVAAIVVTYLPQIQPLAELLTRLEPQVASILIVDNCPMDDRRVEALLSGLESKKIGLTRLGSNLGIARALNVGMEAAAAGGATHVLLNDQDSLPASDLVVGLLRALRELQGQGHRVAAVGPSFVDQVSGRPYRFQVRNPGHWFYHNQEPTEAMPHVQALSLITSGTLMPVESIGAIGTMREDFFIDHVDVEWSHRATAKGYMLFGTRYASMGHSMGERMLRAWIFGWRNLNEYGPLRLYYRYRNFVYLLGLRYVPVGWKLRASCFWLQEAYAHLLFSHARLASLGMIMRGCLDGVRGRMGCYQGHHVQPSRQA